MTKSEQQEWFLDCDAKSDGELQELLVEMNVSVKSLDDKLDSFVTENKEYKKAYKSWRDEVKKRNVIIKILEDRRNARISHTYCDLRVLRSECGV